VDTVGDLCALACQLRLVVDEQLEIADDLRRLREGCQPIMLTQHGASDLARVDHVALAEPTPAARAVDELRWDVEDDQVVVKQTIDEHTRVAERALDTDLELLPLPMALCPGKQRSVPVRGIGERPGRLLSADIVDQRARERRLVRIDPQKPPCASRRSRTTLARRDAHALVDASQLL
jgi:hypothetical protein